MKLEYRADIDGLRAIAVLAVVLFHANYGLFKGGFVGVDVFFVISGFLITSIILKSSESPGQFLKRFYEGRVRRLLPPAIPVVVLTSIAGYYLLSAEAMEEYSKSLVSFIGFVSNWFFWDIAGYFDGPSHAKPLLHTWSLSVEEQFYLFFPIIALLLMRKGRGLVLAATVAIIAVSFLINIYFVVTNDLNSAFFNSLGRFWEMGIGAALACGVLPPPKSNVTKSVIGGLGLAAILGSILFLDSSIAFPGVWALLPTIGAAMVIYAQGGIAARVLSLKPVVGVGLISYALYLWHWPIFAYLNIYFSKPTPEQFAAGIAAAVALASISYFVIEKPIRGRKILPSRSQAFTGFAISMCVFGMVGFGGALTDGYPSRLPNMALEYVEHKKSQVATQRKAALLAKCWVNQNADMDAVIRRCVVGDGRPHILLIGDSHAAQFYAPIKKKFPGHNISLLASNSCSLSTHPIDMSRSSCKALKEFLDSKSVNQFSAVVITTRQSLSGRNLRDFFARTKRVSAKTQVYVLGPIQFYQPNMPAIFEQSAGRKTSRMIASELDAAVKKDQFASDGRYRRIFRGQPRIKYISLIDQMCFRGKCKHFDSQGWPILVDNSHMSLEAATELVSNIKPQLKL
ncbi:acyltransferase family protein [Metapseudomonas furukawaii]|uniref:acyltransferase family protein n=1 Tax=Metapseudomonas furukawaii TaxID=1149133 RepID=UPI0040466123